MTYKEFKKIIESKILSKNEYENLKKEYGISTIKKLFKEYQQKEKALDDEEKFQHIACYYNEEIEQELYTEKEYLEYSQNNVEEIENTTVKEEKFGKADPVKEYLNSLGNSKLLTQQEEYELATKINTLYKKIVDKIIMQNEKYKEVVEKTKEDKRRDLEEKIIDEYLNNYLIKLNYPINKKSGLESERRKQLGFVKRLLSNKMILLKELRNKLEKNNNKLETINEINNLCIEIDNIKDFYNTLNTQLEYLNAFNNFFDSNIRLAVSIAMKRFASNLMGLDDIAQSASIGLIKAMKKFNPDMGYKFSTYATWWIRQAITRYISDHNDAIRKPVHATELLRKIFKTKERITQEKGREATSEEIAEELKISKKKVEELLIIEYTCNPVSLQTKIGEDEDITLEDFIVDERTLPQDEVATDLLKKELYTQLRTLTPREAEVLIKRFGLDNGEIKTLEIIGKEMNITRERVRQIEEKALRKLRHPNRSKHLKDYL